MKSPNEKPGSATAHQNAEISVAALKEKMNAPAKPHIIDIREPIELTSGMIPTAVSIPMTQLLARMAELPKHEPFVLVCASGARSLVAQRYLSQRGYSCQSLAGGMQEWQTEAG